MSDPVDSSLVPGAPAASSKTWKGPLPWLLMSLPALGGFFVVFVSLMEPRHHPAYRELENRLGFWSERPRAVLSQLYIAHATRAGIAPRQIPQCSVQIASGDDLSPCAPDFRGGTEASANLMGDLAEFVLRNTPPREFSEDAEPGRNPAQERPGGFYFGDSPVEVEPSDSDSEGDSGRVFNPDAI